jgi:hypothetical protein
MKLIFIMNLKAFFLFLLIVTGSVFPGTLPLMIFYFAGRIPGIPSMLLSCWYSPHCSSTISQFSGYS